MTTATITIAGCTVEVEGHYSPGSPRSFGRRDSYEDSSFNCTHMTFIDGDLMSLLETARSNKNIFHDMEMLACDELDKKQAA